MTDTVPATKRIRKLSNEIIFFVRETNWSVTIPEALSKGGTSQITVDDVKVFRTGFGTYMVISQLSVTRARPETWDLRDYVCRLLVRTGLDVEITDILAPGRAKHFRVE